MIKKRVSYTCNKTSHDGQLWERIRQIVRVEEPIEFAEIRKRLPEVPLRHLLRNLEEIKDAGFLPCRFVWVGQDVRMLFAYDADNFDQVTNWGSHELDKKKIA